jgi:ABC-type sugar transport system permease subunit
VGEGPLAQLLDKRFAGRRLVRLALLLPWAASLVMTATVWRYIYEGAYGPLNRVLMDLGLLDQPGQLAWVLAGVVLLTAVALALNRLAGVPVPVRQS